MVIKKSEFVISAPTYTKCPIDNKPEYAFIGRSNVGKSSLINMLCQHKNLAKTSSTPGKTLLINHFIINDEWYIVDLPGYGYAKADKLGPGKAKINAELWMKLLENRWETLPPYFITSAESRLGRDDVLNYIENVNKDIKE